MYDPTFGSVALRRHLNKNDFRKQPALKNNANKESVIVQAVSIARNGFASLPLTPNDFAGRMIYQVHDLASDLVLRKAAQNIRRITRVKQSSRMEIVRCLKLFCEEGMPFTVAKIDIKNFYPSIDQDALLTQFERRLVTAPSTRWVVSSLIGQLKNNSVVGLPPGLAISAELSEFYMQDFDRKMRECLTAHYYARYVDDIVLILPVIDSVETLEKQINDALPQGLKINSKKSKVFCFGSTKVSTPSVEHSFDYLGFRFNVYQTNREKPHYRRVKLDIATSKVKKNKTRIAKSLLRYLSDGNFDDLQDRICLLTGGYQFYDERRKKTRNAGLQHTYRLIDTEALALVELDRFLKTMVLCRSGPIGWRLAPSLSNRQRKELLKYSFTQSFANQVHYQFSSDRLKHLTECWKYA